MSKSSQSFRAKVLLVDDEPDLVDIFKSEFEDRDCQVFTASNGKEALEVLKSNQVDVVVTDICMPEMNGMELLQAIEQANGKKPFVVTMSGYSMYTPNQLYTEGSAGFIPKPLKYQQIVELIDNYVLLVAEQNAEDEGSEAA